MKTTEITVGPDRIRLACDVTGEGPALLLVHGFPLDRSLWRHQVDALAGWRRIAPDLRGMGASDVPGGGYSMAAYATDLAGVLDHFGADRAVLCGLSMGGYIAFEFARRWPDRLAGLILMDTRAEADSPDGRRGRDAMIAKVRAQGVASVADDLIPKLLGPEALGRPEIVGRVRGMLEGTLLDGMVGALEAMRDRPDSSALLPALAAVPVQVVVGEEDRLTPPADAERMAAAIPGATLARIPGAGHLAPLERPAATTEVVGRFLARV